MECGTSSATKRYAGSFNVVANVRRAPLPLSFRLLQQTTDVLAIQYHINSQAESHSFVLYQELYDELFFRKTFRNTSKPGIRAASGPLEASSHSSSTKTSDRSLPPHRSLLFPVSSRQFCDTRSCTFYVCAVQRPHSGVLGKQNFTPCASIRAMETPCLRHSMVRRCHGEVLHGLVLSLHWGL
jgi:hypothetical protein